MAKLMPLRHQNKEDIRKDVVSHFVLRLAFCGQQNRSWFITQEVLLLEHRLEAMGENIPEFFSANDFEYSPISEDMFDQHAEALASVYYDCKPQAASMYYPVPFIQAISLLKGRRCVLIGGKALVHCRRLVAIVAMHFRAELSRALSISAKAMASFSDERILPLLSVWSNGYLSGAGAINATGSVDLKDLDQIMARDTPRCMSTAFRVLRREHHLMHGGRMQLGLFLKSIGLSLEDSINFWRSEFTKRADISEKEFVSRYQYNIRHNYGAEGKRTNYSAHSCMKIINSIPSASVTDAHGCPFRASSPDELMRDMTSAGVSPATQADIVKLVQGHHYQIACKAYFDATHPQNKWELTGTTHPTTYFVESQKYWDEKNGASKDKEAAAAADGSDGKSKNLIV